MGISHKERDRIERMRRDSWSPKMNYKINGQMFILPPLDWQRLKCLILSSPAKIYMQTAILVHCCLWENKLVQLFEDKFGSIYKNLECSLPLTHHLYFYEFISQINSQKYAKLYVQDVPCCFLIITATNT